MYNIVDIQSVTPQRGVRYLFDTNVWLAILESSYPSPQYKAYIGFFNKIISNTTKEGAKIVMPSILLSEIIHRKMDWAFDDFLAEDEQRKKNIQLSTRTRRDQIKQHYWPTQHYQNSYKNLRSDINAYHASLEYVPDNFGDITCSQLLKGHKLHMEFNDYIIYKIAAQNGYTLVTNDGDFAVEDMDILTTNAKLLALAAEQATSK